jgi:hypothetical protein
VAEVIEVVERLDKLAPHAWRAAFTRAAGVTQAGHAASSAACHASLRLRIEAPTSSKNQPKKHVNR